MLLARPAIASVLGWSAPVVIVVFLVVLGLGLAPPLAGRHRSTHGTRSMPALVLAGGASVFVVGRVLEAGHYPRATVTLIALNTLASIAEEALFRRLAFDVLLPLGPITAVAGSAVLFGAVHVTVYGWWAFPLDVAAGAVLGWQRWVSGGWAVPAATHALADLLVVI